MTERTLHVTRTPLLATDDDGLVHACYGDQDWSVSAPTEDEAVEKLTTEYGRRQLALGFDEAYRRTLALLDTDTPGVTVKWVDEPDYPTLEDS